MQLPTRWSALVALSLGLATRAAAQIHADAIGGINISRLLSGDIGGYQVDQFRVGAMAGVAGRVPLAGRFGLRPELEWMQLGGKSANSGAIPNQVYRLSYLSVPLLLEYHVPTPAEAPAQPYIFAGGTINTLLGCRYTAPSAPGWAPCRSNGLDPRSTDVGLLFGVGADAGRIRFGGRYGTSLSRVDRSAGSASPKHQYFNFFVGFRIW